MSAIYLLVLASLALAGAFLVAFIWAVRSGQYEDTATPALRKLGPIPLIVRSSSLLEDSLGHKVLIDAGVNGPGVLRDYLRGRGIHKLDVAVVTHPDKDHYGGLLDLPERFRIRQLLVPTTESQDPDYQSLLQRLDAGGTDVTVVGKGAHLSGFGFGVDFLWPDEATRAQFLSGADRTNDVSLVAIVTRGRYRMILTGDMDSPDLLADTALRADLLKSPHHGSVKGNPPGLYDRVRPGNVVAMGRYPTPARLETRFAGTGVKYINTRVDGAVMLRFRGERAVVQRFFGPLPFSGEYRRPSDARSESPSSP